MNLISTNRYGRPDSPLYLFDYRILDVDKDNQVVALITSYNSENTFELDCYINYQDQRSDDTYYHVCNTFDEALELAHRALNAKSIEELP